MKHFCTVIAILAVCVAAPLHAQHAHIGGQLGLGIPVGGDFGKAYKLGFGANADFVYELDTQWSLTGYLGLTTFSYGNADRPEISGSYTTVPLEVGLRYNFGAGRLIPYGGAELGLHFISRRIEDKRLTTTLKSDQSEQALGINLLGGFLYEINPGLTLDINLKYNMIFGELEESPSFLGINAGVVFPVSL